LPSSPARRSSDLGLGLARAPARRETERLGLNVFRSSRVYTFLLILLILDGLLLTVVVLLQSGKGGGLAAMGGAGTATDSVIGGRQAATLLTKASWAGGRLFLALALILSILSTRATRAEAILREVVQRGPVQPRQRVGPGTAPKEGTGEQPAAIPGTAPAGEPQTPPDGQ